MKGARAPATGRPTVVLFDIDGTLVTTGGAGHRAMCRAFARVTGRHDACDRIVFDGMTDVAIARQGLRAVAHPDGPAEVERLLTAYIEYLADEVPRTPEHRVFSGVREAVAGVLGKAWYAVGLATGNVRAGATLKLAPVGLDAHFAFGGFGDDHELRPEVVRAGASRGARALGVALEECRVVVVGDTPRDVEAARAIGAECLAVATGRFGVDELRAAGADVACGTLADVPALEALGLRHGALS